MLYTVSSPIQTARTAGSTEATGQTEDGATDPATPQETPATPKDTPTREKADEPVAKVPERKSTSRAKAKRRAARRKANAEKRRAAREQKAADKKAKEDAAQAGDDILAGSDVVGVPNMVLSKFQIPPFLIPIYEAAGTEYGIRWEVLAAINAIETDYGRNLNVSSAGALGWMQFMPPTWEMYGVDANNDGVKDPYNPVDAIFAAARYLKAAGAQDDIRKAIFAYNHADWYVDLIITRAEVIAGMPDALIGSISGLTRGHFPVFARAHYEGALSKKNTKKRVKLGENAANIIDSNGRRKAIDIYSKRNAPVVAVQDAVVTAIGENAKLGKYVKIQDGYGNRYTYSKLGSLAKKYPVPRLTKSDLRASRKNGALKVEADPVSKSAGKVGRSAQANRGKAAKITSGKRGPQLTSKERFYAYPDRPFAQKVGSYEQLMGSGEPLKGYETFKNYFSRPYGLKRDDVVLRPLRKGSRLIGGTILGRIGKAEFGSAPYVRFGIRPAGEGAPKIDPKPILDGWKLLESTAIYRAAGLNPLVARDGDATVGQILLMSKTEVERYVLNSKDIEIYDCGRRDIKAGRIDRRVLATLGILAASNMKPTVSSLQCGHGVYTSSGNVSHHSYGTAVDIAAINGTPIVGNQGSGGVTERAVRLLMTMQGSMEAAQIISLLELGGATIAMNDHADHIHLGFQPAAGSTRGGSIGQGPSALKRSQWYKLFDRLDEIENPTVPVKPSRYSIKLRKQQRRSGHADD